MLTPKTQLGCRTCYSPYQLLPSFGRRVHMTRGRRWRRLPSKLVEHAYFSDGDSGMPLPVLGDWQKQSLDDFVTSPNAMGLTAPS